MRFSVFSVLALSLGCSCGSSKVAATDGGGERADDPMADGALMQGAGTWDDPIIIESVPFVFDGDTLVAPANQADSYQPCAPSTNEGGGEFVFQITLEQPERLVISVDDQGGDAVDVDVHLLEEPRESSCIARDNRELGASLAPNTYWISVDTWVDGNDMAMAGPFRLQVSSSTGAEICSVNPIPDCTDGDAPLVNGVPTELAGVGACPPGMRPVDGAAFCIDTYEAALVKVEADNSLSPWSPYLNPGSERVRALSAPGLVPQGHINQLQAASACAEAGKRLCTDSEWLRACRGSGDSQYPYGDDHRDDVCNEERSCHPVIQFYETSADWIWSEMNNSCLNQLPEGLALTGEHDGCVTEEGAMDMMGNLHEWTSDPAGTFRGGFYVDTVINGAGCDYRTTAHDVNHSDYSTGFRCCQ